MTNEELAKTFEKCSEDAGPLYPVMMQRRVPIGKRLTLYQTFESYKAFSDPELYFDTIATKNWRSTAFCFAAAMVRTGDFK